MGVSDGTIQDLNGVLVNGPNDERMNVVLVAEGFTAAEQATFDGLCDDFVASLQAEYWYPLFGDAINVHRLNVASTESGTDQPATCEDGNTGSGAAPATYFDSSFCNGDIWRCLSGDESIVRATLTAELPQWDVAAVLVNTTDHGGCASGDVFWTSVKPGWEGIALHEIGHAGFGLADEYQYWAGCGTDTDRDNAPASEPSTPNITTVTDRASLKWRHLLTPGIAVPTMLNPDCSECDNRPNVISDDAVGEGEAAVGLFESAGYFHCGRFRGSYDCRMRHNASSFCRVCVEAIAARTNTYVPATPHLEVAPTSLAFGDVAHGLTLYRAFEVRNVRSGRPGALRVTLTPPTGGFTYAPGTDLSFTLPAPITSTVSSRLVFVSFTSVVGESATTGALEVTTADDPAHASITVTLSARPVPPPPVDSVLVIDRSGSMDEDSGVMGVQKVDMALEAARLYVSLLKDNDQIGVVRYNQDSGPADVLLTLRTAGAASSGAGRLAANGVLNLTTLDPDGLTSIGGGIINGSGVLDAATADSRALVVLTDGRHNRSPDIAAARAVVTAKSPAQRVFAVGLGLNQLEDRLEQIANVTGGTAQITGDLVDEREFLLQKLYVQILSDVGDEAFVRDPARTAMPGEKQSTDIWLGEVDVACDFIVVFRHESMFPKYLEVALETPDGTLVTPTDMAGMGNAQHVVGHGHVYSRLHFPVWPTRSQAHAGRWKVWVGNAGRFETHQSSPLVYSVMAKARSDLRLGGRVVQPSRLPGTAMDLVLEPTLYGLPITVDEPVRLEVRRPDGVVRVVTADRDEFGAYRAAFADTGLVGPYLVSTEVSASTPLGHRVTRFRQMTGLIFVPGQDGDDGWGDGSQDEDCREARRAIKILTHVVDRCCDEKEG